MWPFADYINEYTMSIRTLRGPMISISFSYGDRTPRSAMGRVFSVSSTLIGLVTIAVLLGSLTSSLTTDIVFSDVKLYGIKVIRIQCIKANFQ